MMEKSTIVKSPEFLLGGGEMGERIRNYDWQNTPLGDPEGWEQSLKTCVRIMLTSPQPMFVWWGKELINIYNDAYRFVMGEKHPDGLGKSGDVVWKEIWPEVSKRAEIVFSKNEGTFDDGLLLLMNRYGYVEETYFKFSYNPIPGDNGGTKGLFCACSEETERVINDRSLETLARLSAYAIGCQHENEVFEKAALTLSENPHDFPFALFYKISDDGLSASLTGSSGIKNTTDAAPQRIDLGLPHTTTWPIRESIDKKESILIENINELFPDLPTGYWDIAPGNGIVIPVNFNGTNIPNAVFIAGLNPYRKPDEKYLSFLKLVVEKLAQLLVNVNNIEQERKRIETIEELDRAKTLFFSNISHEFRTPITLMLGPLEELLAKPTSNFNEAEKQSLAATHRNALRLLRLVNTLLDFSRIESGRQLARYQLTDIDSFTLNLSSNFRSAIEKAGLKFIVDTKPVRESVYVDRQLWEKIVFNLLSNAFKYTLEGSITVELYSTNDSVILHVKDTGVGIPSKELPHMFDRFHRAKNVVGRTYEGTGIGLSLTKELVLMHGGTISVDSTEGEGSVFTVVIPVGKNHLPESNIHEWQNDFDEEMADLYVEEITSLTEVSTDESHYDDEASVSDLDDPVILIVDDNADMRQHIRSILGAKYRTLTAANGLDALHKINQQMPSLILSDIMMPLMDGIELLRQVKDNKRTAHIPVIFITARAGEESRVEGYETGADDYLVKPFSVKELIARIQSQLRIVKLRQRAEMRLRDFFMQSPVAIAVLKGEKFIIEIANKKVLEFWGRAEEEIIGKPIFEALGEVAGQGFETLLRQVMNTGQRYIDEERGLDILRQGKLIHVYVKFIYEPLVEEDGSTSGVIVMVEEITDQVVARKRMEKTNRELQISATLTQSIPDAVIATDMNANIMSWNTGAENLYGYTEEEVLGKPGREILKTVFLSDADSEAWQHQLNTRGWWRGEVVQYKKDGSPVPVMVSIAYVKDDEGNPVAGVGVNRDITEQKAFAQKLEQMVSERTAQLNTSIEELKSFNYIASHDLQEPLRKIQIFIDLLQRHREDPLTKEKYMGRIKDASNRMSQLIKSVLDYSRLSYTDEAFQSVDLNNILADVLNDYELILTEKNAIVESPVLPTIRAIPYQMHQMMSNLVSNALKFNNHRPHIHITCNLVKGYQVPTVQYIDGDKEFIELSFIDNGIGFEGEYSNKIMQLFQRLHNNAEYPGSGVGLSIVKKIVDHHHGVIHAHSEKGQGATFMVWLPV